MRAPFHPSVDMASVRMYSFRLRPPTLDPTKGTICLFTVFQALKCFQSRPRPSVAEVLFPRCALPTNSPTPQLFLLFSNRLSHLWCLRRLYTQILEYFLRAEHQALVLFDIIKMLLAYWQGWCHGKQSGEEGRCEVEEHNRK
jgi:hypothetical protein